MDVQHSSVLAREKRLSQGQDMMKRRQYRVEHGLEEETHERPSTLGEGQGVAAGTGDDQSPVAAEGEGEGGAGKEEYVDFEGKRRPVKKWLGIW